MEDAPVERAELLEELRETREETVRVAQEEAGREREPTQESAAGGFFEDSGGSPTGRSLSSALAVSALAPPFTAVHRSWEEFDAQLKAYAQSTYQLYVVRTTTSVSRRNIRIAELAATASTTGLINADADDAQEDGEDGDFVSRQANDTSTSSDRLMIPSHWKWYSKTMMCTHGWKDRHRGTGKRSMTMVRSTGCPVKMCITLQHTSDAADDESDDGWRVVVTKHVRTHNHPLSRELFLFYTENRRIYDPELLALVGGNSPSNGHVVAEFYGAFGEEEEDSTHAGQAASLEDTSALPNSLAPMSPKAFSSWDQFHSALVEYSLSTQQHFRIRSTISAQSKNAKILEQASKAGKTEQEIAVHLVPETQKWYSKLLICNHGWKRKSRSKMTKFQRRGTGDEWSDTNPNACPAMIMARLQRDIHDKWRIVINRQVLMHNHSLFSLEASETDQIEDGIASDLEDSATTSAALLGSSVGHDNTHELSTTEDEQNDEFVNAAVQHLDDLQIPQTRVEEEQNQGDEDSGTLDDANAPETEETPLQSLGEEQTAQRQMSVVTEVVVRVAKLVGVHESWEAFHECLQRYSERTYQSYRTRTTSSVKGRNHKILEMRTQSENTNIGQSSDNGPAESTRLIPEEFKWYSKTLTCTHGWKERRRGAGKRTIHIVRSTLCPVKICATLQYLEPNTSTGVNEAGWRVVVTKHIVDHNHNLSRELYQHYCDNRRIYDPDLLTIDQSSTPVAGGSASSSARVSTDSAQPLGDQPAVAGMPSIGDDHQTFFAGAAAMVFDQNEPFGSHQHSLPEAAYVASGSSASAHQVPLSTTSGIALMSYSSMIAVGSGLLQSDSSSAQGVVSSLAMQQMFESGAGYPSVVYAAALPASDFQGASNGMTINVLCQLHGNTPSSERSDNSQSGTTADCTCLRVPVVHQFATAAATTPEVETQGKRRTRGNDHSLGVVALKRSRPGETDSAINPHRVTDHSVGTVSIATNGPNQVWSPENPAQAFPVTDVDGTTVWRAPRLKRRHENWMEFTDHLNAYSEATFQLYRVRTTSSIAARNVRISQQIQQMQENGVTVEEQHDEEEEVVVPQLVPTSYEWYSKTYVCTHGWKERRRGKGQRVSHNLRSTACPVKICVTLQRDPHDSENWNVVVTKHVLDHNHEISASMFQSYSENRRIKDPELLARAEQMWREGQPRRKVFEFLKGATKCNILMKDVHNLVQRWQQHRSDEVVAEQGDHQAAADPGSIVDLID